MDELASIYILKNFEESLKNEVFLITNGIFVVEFDYVSELLVIFSISEDVALKTLEYVSKKLGYKLFILNYKSIVEDLGDLEESLKYSSIDFKEFVLSIINRVIKIKFKAANVQKYDKAAFYRDIELDLKKIFHPKLLKTNDITRINAFLRKTRRNEI